jgi:DNA-binding MarR family transcriptional regulator
MLTNVRPTSIDTYRSLQANFGAQTFKILAFLHANKHRDYTRREIASYLKIDTSSVSARVNKLVKDEVLIEIETKRKCSITGVTSFALSLPEAQKAAA